jgi:cation transport ATPase
VSQAENKKAAVERIADQIAKYIVSFALFSSAFTYAGFFFFPYRQHVAAFPALCYTAQN